MIRWWLDLSDSWKIVLLLSAVFVASFTLPWLLYMSL